MSDHQLAKLHSGLILWVTLVGFFWLLFRSTSLFSFPRSLCFALFFFSFPRYFEIGELLWRISEVQSVDDGMEYDLDQCDVMIGSCCVWQRSNVEYKRLPCIVNTEYSACIAEP